MSGMMDCAVLLHPAREHWLNAWMARSSAANPRLRLHACELAQTGDGSPSVHALRDASLSLRRYDVAVLPVSYASLSWARTALAGVSRQHILPIPLMALIEGLRAPAIQDLFELGVADFLRADDSLDDLRVRLTQMTCTQPSPPDVSADAAPPNAHANETFHTAKTRVIACFERDYIAKALSRHAGNISMAARSAQKHRRAFWALMRKHQIDAAPYRRSFEDRSEGP